MASIPVSSGPYGVSHVDVQFTPGGQPITDPEKTRLAHTFNPIEKDSHRVSPPSILVRLYYPSILSKDEWVMATKSCRTLRSEWVVNGNYFHGYGNFGGVGTSGVPLSVIRFFFGKPKLSSVPGLRLGSLITDAENATSEDERKFPIIIFSHGLGGMRTSYSFLQSEMASYGFVVFAIEHRDHSACLSFLPNGESLPYIAPPTYPHVLWDFRYRQLKYRTEELRGVFDLIHAIQEGTFLPNMQELFTSNDKGTSRGLLCPLKLPPHFLKYQGDCNQFKGKLDVSRIVLAGHSFGAATCFFSLTHDGLPSKISAIIALDPWMYPIPKDIFLPKGDSVPPVLVINSEMFHWPENKEHLNHFMERIVGRTCERDKVNNSSSSPTSIMKPTDLEPEETVEAASHSSSITLHLEDDDVERKEHNFENKTGILPFVNGLFEESIEGRDSLKSHNSEDPTTSGVGSTTPLESQPTDPVKEPSTSFSLWPFPKRLITTIVSTAHSNQSDIPLVAPKWLLRRMGRPAPIDPYRALLLNACLIRAFLSSHISSLSNFLPQFQPIFDIEHLEFEEEMQKCAYSRKHKQKISRRPDSTVRSINIDLALD